MAHFARTLGPKMERFRTRAEAHPGAHRAGRPRDRGRRRSRAGPRPSSGEVRDRVGPHLEWLGVANDDPILKWLAETVDSIGAMDNSGARSRCVQSGARDAQGMREATSGSQSAHCSGAVASLARRFAMNASRIASSSCATCSRTRPTPMTLLRAIAQRRFCVATAPHAGVLRAPRARRPPRTARTSPALQAVTACARRQSRWLRSSTRSRRRARGPGCPPSTRCGDLLRRPPEQPVMGQRTTVWSTASRQ